MPDKQQRSSVTALITLRNRIIAGVVLLLPLFVTYIVIKWLYDTFIAVLIGPIRDFLLRIWYPDAETL